MARDISIDAASRQLIAFVRSFVELLERQLQEVRITTRETVDGVMAGILEISHCTEEKKRKANEVLTSTYMDPDGETNASVNAMQDEVSRVFDKALSGGDGSDNTGGNDDKSDLIRRSAERFSKHVEALGTIDGDLQGLLISMMGFLSREDVTSQRIEHVVASLHALQAGLSYVLIDFNARCKEGDVERFIDDLKRFTYASYTMQEERVAFEAIFTGFKKAC